MRNKKILSIICIGIILFLTKISMYSGEKAIPVQSNIEKGNYIPKDIVTLYNFRFLPVPKSANDYIFYQSIQKTSNVVIGKFRQGEKEILLLQDNNNDGKIDIAAHWGSTSNRIDKESEPDKYCSAETFKKLKDAIINGKNESFILGGKAITIAPNKEALSELEALIKNSSNVVKSKEGLRINKLDPDEPSKEMEIFSYAVNSNDGTANLAFEIKYFYNGLNRVSPIINMGVYCFRSEDPFAIETIKKIREIVAKYIQW
jgi:hypothetical protein